MPRPNLKRWLLKNFWGGQGQGRDRPSNGKWYLPFCSLYFFFLERETHKANINWIFKEFFIPRLIHVNVNYRRHFVFIICFSLIRAFSLHFLQPFYSYFFFFSPTQKSLSRNVWNVSKIERKKIHIFYLLSWLRIYVSSIVAVFSNEKEERTFSYGFSKKSFLSKKLKREKYLCSSFQVRWLERGCS